MVTSGNCTSYNKISLYKQCLDDACTDVAAIFFYSNWLLHFIYLIVKKNTSNLQQPSPMKQKKSLWSIPSRHISEGDVSHTRTKIILSHHRGNRLPAIMLIPFLMSLLYPHFTRCQAYLNLASSSAVPLATFLSYSFSQACTDEEEKRLHVQTVGA